MPDDDRPRRTDLDMGQRLARVEEQIDHQSKVLARIETRLDEDHDQLVARVEEIEPQHQRLWLVYQSHNLWVGADRSKRAVRIGLLFRAGLGFPTLKHSGGDRFRRTCCITAHSQQGGSPESAA